MRNALTLGLLAALATSAWAQSKLTGIETKKVGDGLNIVIHGEGLAQPKTIRVNNSTSYIVEFRAYLVGKFRREKVDCAGVQYVQVGWFKPRPATVRVLVKTDGTVSPELTNSGGEWVITVGVAAEASPKVEQFDAFNTQKSVTVSDLEAQSQKEMDEAEKLLLAETGPSASANVESKATLSEEPSATVASAPREEPKPEGGRLPAPMKIEPLVPEVKPVKRTGKNTTRVSLDFVGTDVVQILKALSIQAGVNIVTTPNVSPSDKPVKLSITLNSVELDSALSLVTASAGLRYARVGDTFVVAPSNEFPAMIRQVLQRDAANNQTRVVNLISGEANEIKESTLRAFPPEGDGGYYEIIVPGRKDQMTPPVNPAPQPNGQEGGTEPAPGQATQPDSTVVQHSTPKSSRAYYVMLVGDPNRLSEVEKYVRELDGKVAASFSLSASKSIGTVAIPIQSGQTERIKEMITKLLDGNPRAADYSITESNVKELEQSEQGIKFLLMIGPSDELATLKTFALGLDRELCKPLGIRYAEEVDMMVKDYEVVELMYLEPIVTAQDLKGRFKDLWVTVVPDNVTPGLLGEGESKKDEAPTDGGGKENSSSNKQESKLKKIIGREPMKLMFRGSRSTIEEAKRYLSMIDVPPRQVALEMRVMELTREEALKFGLDWNIGLGGTGTVRLNNSSSSNNTISGTVGTASVSATLDSISNNRNLIARPNALVSDGRTTHLFVGDTVRYVKQVQASQSGITVITDEVQVGSQFDIKARVGANGSIALDLDQRFTILTAFTDIPGNGQLPQTSDRTSTMFVNMKSGETIAIGGLILDQDFKNYSGIPILKDLPIIGRLFGKTNNSRSRTEIVFFLTAVEVDETNRVGAASPGTLQRRNPNPTKEYKETGVNKK